MSLTLITCSLLVSCSNFDATGMAKKSYKSVATLIPRRLPVTEVRPKDLEKMASGADRAMAWDRHLDSKRYVFFAPKNYKAPKLPDARTLPTDGGLLPPLHPGRGSTLKGKGDMPRD